MRWERQPSPGFSPRRGIGKKPPIFTAACCGRTRAALRQDPGRQDLAQALEEAEAAVQAAGSSSLRTLAPLLQKWIELLLAYDRLRTLQRFKHRL